VLSELSLSSVGASILAIAGTVVLLRCVWDFFAKGKGTLAPIDPPRVLVVSGLYRFTRNPMYNGVLALILGEAWLFGSVSLLKYALLVLVLFHLFVVLSDEEPALTSTVRGVLSRHTGEQCRAGASPRGHFKRARRAADRTAGAKKSPPGRFLLRAPHARAGDPKLTPASDACFRRRLRIGLSGTGFVATQPLAPCVT
jgi:hypothetical protein